VYWATDNFANKIFALKKIRLHEDDQGIPATTIREISVLKELRHRNIVMLYDVFHKDKRLYLVFEYCDLDLKKLTEVIPDFFKNSKLIKYYLYQILVGVAYCHQRRILHRDLKPQNLLIDWKNNYVKLADFGLARVIGVPVRAYTQEVITLWYRAPELLMGACYYGTSIDIWSIGCIFAEMVTGTPLFPGDSEIDELYKIFNIMGTPNEGTWPGITHLPDYSVNFPKWRSKQLRHYLDSVEVEGVDLLGRMLAFSPIVRLAAQDALQHPYFRDVIEPYKRLDRRQKTQSTLNKRRKINDGKCLSALHKRN